MQYARWKEECRQIFPVIGSGRFITAPIINEDGQPIQDPLVLLEANPGKGVLAPPQDGVNGNATGSSNTNTANKSEPVKDKKVIQWMLTLHQIGLYFLVLSNARIFFCSVRKTIMSFFLHFFSVSLFSLSSTYGIVIIPCYITFL